METETTAAVASDDLGLAADPAVRRTMIGGSDAAKACGVSRWGGPLDVYLEKTGTVEPPDEESEAAEWGLILEPVLLQQLAMREGAPVVGLDLFKRLVLYDPDGTTSVVERDGPRVELLRTALGTLRHPVHGFLGCHLDGVRLGTDGGILDIVEAKTASAFRGREWGDPDTDAMPEDYVVQCQHNAMVAEAALGVAVPVVVGPTLIGGQRWQIQRVRPLAELQEQILGIEIDLWDRIQRLDPPEPGPGKVGARALSLMYPADSGEERVIDLVHPLYDVVLALKGARQAVDDADAEKVRIENLVKAEMGEASKLLGDGWSISWKKTKDREVVDYEAVVKLLATTHHISAADVASAVSMHTTVRPGPRTFRPNLKGMEA